MSDTVWVTIIAAIPTTIAAIGVAIANVTRRNVNTLAETVKKEAALTRQHVQQCCHPDDLPPRATAYPSNDVRP